MDFINGSFSARSLVEGTEISQRPTYPQPSTTLSFSARSHFEGNRNVQIVQAGYLRDQGFQRSLHFGGTEIRETARLRSSWKIVQLAPWLRERK